MRVEMKSPEGRTGGDARRPSMFEVAKSYLDRGWSIIPVCPPSHARCSRWHEEHCQSPGKAPLVSWAPFQTELATEAQLKEWFDFWPNANVGVACGPVSRMIAIDVDGEDGQALLARFVGEHELPETQQFLTGRPGSYRLLYSLPDGHPAPMWPMDTPEGETALTIIGQGGQTVMPPSLHASGGQYSWVDVTVPVAEAPAWLLERLKAREAETASGTNRARVFEGDGELIPRGGRNTRLLSMGGAVRRLGATETEVRAFLTEVNNRCDPPMHQAEVNRITRSLMRYAPAEVPAFRQLVEQATRPATACLVEMQDVDPKTIQWVWPGWIPAGMLVCIDGDGGVGKALELSTLIPTPTGWTTMGEVQPGDQVFDEQGNACRVVAATEVMRGRPCYRVTFSDGTQVVADAQHQWQTTSATERYKVSARRYKAKRRGGTLTAAQAERIEARAAIVTTEEIASRVWSGRNAYHAIAVTMPLRLPERELPIDPYTLGVWLGDGTSSCGNITKNGRDEIVVRRIEEAGFRITRHDYDDKSTVWTVHGLEKLLREQGLLNNKHVPPEYLRASEEQRTALLHGLMDTDGHASKQGRSEFTSTRKELADAVYELAASFGWKPRRTEGRAKLYGRDVGPCYDVGFTPPGEAFSLPRKGERTTTKRRATAKWRYIVSCEPVPSVPVRCIQVDSPSHLYLITEAMIPTHNSSVMIDLMARITRGDAMPDGSRPTAWPEGTPQNVLLICCEDALAETIRPRIDAAGGDVKRFKFLEEVCDPKTAEVRSVEFPRDLDTIAAVVADNDIRLVCIDPVLAFLGAENDYSRDQDVRRAVGRLKRIAEEKGCAFVYVRHWNKGSQGSKASYRGGGSLAWSNLARSQVIVGHSPDREGCGEWHNPKNNLAPKQKGLVYRAVPVASGVTKIEWLGRSDRSPDEVSNGKVDEDRVVTTPVPDSCATWLRSFLADPTPADIVREEAQALSYGQGQLLEAQREVGAVSRQQNGVWVWSLKQKTTIGG